MAVHSDARPHTKKKAVRINPVFFASPGSSPDVTNRTSREQKIENIPTPVRLRGLVVSGLDTEGNDAVMAFPLLLKNCC